MKPKLGSLQSLLLHAVLGALLKQAHLPQYVRDAIDVILEACPKQ